MLQNYSRGRVPACSLLLTMVCLASPAARMEAAVTPGTSSWVWQNPLPQGDMLNGISCPTTTVCYAVGGPGTIIATTNGGANWNGQSSNTNVALRAISCASTTTCAAVGDQGTVLFTNTSGNTWSKQRIGTTEQLTGVSCPTTTICYALGSSAGIWRTGSLGSEAFVQISTSTGLTAISCPNPASDSAVCYVAGGGLSSAKVARLSFGFTTFITFGGIWSVVSLPIPQIGGTLMAISCPNDSTCVAVTDGEKAVSGFNMIGTTNSGQSWNGTVTGSMSLYSVSCVNSIPGSLSTEPLCYAVGDASGTPSNQVFVASPNAVNLGAPVSAGDPFNHSNDHGILLGVSCQPAEVTVAGELFTRGMCFAVGWGGAIVTDSPSGSTWTGQETTVGQSQGLLQNGNEGELQAVSCPQPGTCFAIGNATGFLASTNGGAWSVKNSTIDGFAINCPNATVCFVGGQNSLLATSDGGTTWTQQYPSGLNPNQISSISCPSTSICVAAGDEYSLFTTNGKTWSVVTPIGVGNAVSCPTTTECVGVADSGNFVFTTNLGSTGTKWTIAGTNVTTNNLFAVSCPTATQCFAVGDTGGAGNQPGTFLDGRFNTSSNTWTWQVLVTPAQLGDSFSGISCLPGSLFLNNLCYATTFGGEIVSFTTSFGQPIFNLEAAIDPFPGFRDVSCAALVSSAVNYECLAVGYEATILSKTVGSVGTGVLSPASGSGDVGQPTTIQLTWTVPSGQVWRDLEYVELKLSGASGIGLWARFIPGEPASDFALLDDNGNIVAEGSPGTNGVLDSPTATLDLANSSFAAAGPTSPTVAVNLVVIFKPSTAGGDSAGDGSYKTEISAASVGGTVQQPQHVGEWVVFVSGAPASGTACNGVYNQNFSGDLTVLSGQSCVFVGGVVSGYVALKGGRFQVSNAAVGGNVEIDGASTFALGPSATIDGNLEIHNLEAGTAPNQVCGVSVQGNLEVHDNAAAVSLGNQASCSGNTIGGDLQVHNNSAATTVNGNTVSGNLQDQNNTGTTEVFKNVVQGVLSCSQNALITGGQDSAKQKQGQCANF
jgi:photosystem II stability/assembly factor-like uncharacterized protein